ncbi:DUF421 domain-containing protein [Aquabacterium soli]|uniref:DUF421 domain-containing protein n=1 Tax=Aquabacterium soli TaxID=2493092 RepID=A0A426VGN1_9BURK|nr:YetF domain-containing protein [Aquabacterium soli]RRS06054.1 DUF421 domain-containing protein [Aquabacterium soli]
MFDLDLPWWEFILRGAIIYGALLVLVRVSGKRTVGQFTPFDLIVVLLLSEGVSAGLTGGDDSVGGGLLVVTTLIGLNLLVAMASSRSKRLEVMFEGNPVLIGRDGQFFEQVLKRHHVGDGDVQKSLREADCDLHEMRYAFLETDGTISIQKKRGN